ncbi:MAG: hypothetical protein R3292_06075 [Alcanivorax sp.]|nr:hypothetical protein [Alcanivorax sp.]
MIRTRRQGRTNYRFLPIPTCLALALILGGVLLTSMGVSFQLVSMACCFSGVAIAILDLFRHLVRQRPALVADLLVLCTLMIILLAEPMLPGGLQDTLEYLRP